MDRYQMHQIQALTTNCTGQIDIQIADKITFTQFRESKKRYFQRNCL